MTSAFAPSLLIIGSFLLLALIRLPVAIAAGLAGVFGTGLAFGGLSSSATLASVLPMSALGAIQNEILLTIPFLLGTSAIVAAAGAGRALFDFALGLTKSSVSAPALATIVATLLMAIASPNPWVTTSSIGAIAVPAMQRGGYPPTFIRSVMTMCAAVAALVPPSVYYIIIADTAGISVAELMAEGYAPAILLFVLIVASLITTGRAPNPGASAEELDSRRRHGAGLAIAVAAAAPQLGVLAGLLTPSEAAALMLIVSATAAVLTGTLSVTHLPTVLIEPLRATGMIVLIFIGGQLLARAMVLTGSYQQLTDWLVNATRNDAVIAGAVLGICIAATMAFDVIAAAVILVGFVMPLAKVYGFEASWTGVIFLVTLCLGSIVPPYGSTLRNHSTMAPHNEGQRIGEARLPAMLLAVTLVVCWTFPGLVTGAARIISGL